MSDRPGSVKGRSFADLPEYALGDLKLVEAFVAGLALHWPGHQLIQGNVESLVSYPAIGHHVVSWHITP
jgi:hypothetical protein